MWGRSRANTATEDKHDGGTEATFEQLVNYMDQKIQELDCVHGFVRKLIKDDAERAKDRAKLCDKFMKDIDKNYLGQFNHLSSRQSDEAKPALPLQSVWACTLDEEASPSPHAEHPADAALIAARALQAARAKRLGIFASTASLDVLSTMDRQVRDMEASRKKLAGAGKNAIRALHELQAKTKAARTQATKERKASDDAARKLDKAESKGNEKDVMKAREKAEGCAASARQAEEEASTLEAELSATAALLHGEELPALIGHLYEMERKRSSYELSALAALQRLRRESLEDALAGDALLNQVLEKAHAASEVLQLCGVTSEPADASEMSAVYVERYKANAPPQAAQADMPTSPAAVGPPSGPPPGQPAAVGPPSGPPPGHGPKVGPPSDPPPGALARPGAQPQAEPATETPPPVGESRRASSTWSVSPPPSFSWFYVGSNKEQLGPVPTDELLALLHDDTSAVCAETLVWHSAMDEWTAFGEVPELAPHVIGTRLGVGGGGAPDAPLNALTLLDEEADEVAT